NPNLAVGVFHLADKARHSLDRHRLRSFGKAQGGILQRAAGLAGTEVHVATRRRHRSSPEFLAVTVLHDPANLEILDRFRRAIAPLDAGGPGFIARYARRSIERLDRRVRKLQEGELLIPLGTSGGRRGRPAAARYLHVETRPR